MKQASFLLLALLAACAPTVANRGNLLTDAQLATIKPGISTRTDVLETLGSPTQIATFDDRAWYYIGQRTERVSFLDPEIIEQRAVRVVFDEAGLVEKISPLDPAVARPTGMVDRQTPTYGKQVTIMEQLLGNLGRGLPGDTDR